MYPGCQVVQKETPISVKNQVIICLACLRSSKTSLIPPSATVIFFFFQVKLQVQLRFDEPLASWLKKKEDCQAGKLRCTKLSSKSSNSEDMGQPKTHWFPQWKAGAPSPWEGCFGPLWPGTSFQGHALQFSRLLYRAQEACLIEPRFPRDRPSAMNKPQTYLWWSE